jgi:hypothetical protein
MALLFLSVVVITTDQMKVMGATDEDLEVEASLV